MYPSVEAVASIHLYRAAREKGASQREAAKQARLPRSTLRGLDSVGRRQGVEDERDALLLSPAGHALLRDLLDTVLFVFCLAGGVGLPTFKRFLKLARLDGYVASSHACLHQRLAALEAAYNRECDEERALLAARTEEPASVVIGLDETFFGSRTCLVAADLLTGFLLVETFAEARDRAAWNTAWVEGTLGIPLSVAHAVSDGARGIQAFLTSDLDVFRAPDLFHVMHDIGKAFACHLARNERRAQEREEDARSVYEAIGELELRERGETRRGRPVDFKGRKAQGRGCIASAAREVLVAGQRREEFRMILAALGAAYFPVVLATGEIRTAGALRKELEDVFASLHDLAKSSDLGEHHAAYLRKAERCIPEMVEALENFHAQMAAEIGRTNLDSGNAHVLKRFLVPAALLEERARNAPTAEERRTLRTSRDGLLGEAAVALACEVTAPTFGSLLRLAADLAALWQRTTSSIEGRNGTLSQRHHTRRGLSDAKLRCATNVHNFFIRRGDGTTAAERFFGKTHRDVARAALNSMGDLKRPRLSRQAA